MTARMISISASSLIMNEIINRIGIISKVTKWHGEVYILTLVF